MSRSRPHGFTLVELLVTVAIIGIVASIAVMSYLSAINRARQKRTINDMRMIATAWEARATDTQTYLVAGAGFSFPAGAVSTIDLRNALVPTYIREFPIHDGWLNPFTFGVEETTTTKNYAIRSAGRDGLYQASYVEGLTKNPDCDIVFSNGAFLAYPAQAQEK